MRYSSKLIYTFSFLLIFSFNSFAQELHWYSWNEGYKKAKKENKIILLDTYTEWCSWCKVMDRDTYTVKEVKDKIADDFIPIKLNPEVSGTYIYDGKEYSGKALRNKLARNKFRGYPTTFFVYPKTGGSYMEIGYIKADRFAKILGKYAAKSQ